MKADLNEAPSTALHYRLAIVDGMGNKSTLDITAGRDGALIYNYWGGHSPSGTPFSLGNMQVGYRTDESLPHTMYEQDTHGELLATIVKAVDSGVVKVHRVIFALE